VTIVFSPQLRGLLAIKPLLELLQLQAIVLPSRQSFAIQANMGNWRPFAFSIIRQVVERMAIKFKVVDDSIYFFIYFRANS
jgi:hypothetical protein